MRNCIALTISVVIVVAALASPVHADASVVFPRTRAGEIAQAYFESLNSGNADQIRAFEASYRSASALGRRPLDQRVPGVLGYHSQLGVLDPVAIKEETATSIALICKSEKLNMSLAVKLVLEETEPFKLETVQIMPASMPAKTKIGEWNNLSDLLTLLAKDPKVPAIAAAVIENGAIADYAVVGVRALGSSDAAAPDDRFHIGSVAKSMTATMIGRLVELGLLDWDTTIASVLTDMEMLPAYRNVTVEQLLSHLGGIQPYTDMSEEDEKRFAALPGTPTEIRTAFVSEVLLKDPAGPIGNHSYSNAGYSVAALMAERVSKKAWEDLMREYVFVPAKMEQSGFGWPATSERPEQPRGHFVESGEPRVQGLEEYPLGPYMAPAGDVNMSIRDLARFALVHLDGLRGQDGAIKSATVIRLHKTPGTGTSYAGGWMVDASSEMGPAHWHAGSAGTFYAHVVIYPDSNRAIVVATNVGIGGDSAVGAAVVNQVLDEVNGAR